MRKLIRYLKDYKKESVIGPIFKLLEASFELFVPILMAQIIDIGIKNRDITYIYQRGVLLLLLGAVGLSCSLTAQYFAAKASVGFGTLLRKEMYAHINGLSYTQLDAIGTSTLITRMINDIQQVQSGVNLLLRLFLRSPFIVVGALIAAFSISIKIGVIFLITIPILSLVIYGIMSFCIPLYKQVQKKLDRVSLKTRENLTGVRVIRAFARQPKEMEEFNDISRDLVKTQAFVGKISALMNPLTYIIVNLAIIAVIWFGGKEVDKGALTQGEVVALVNYMTQILLALIALSLLITSFTKATASAARINEVFFLKENKNNNNNQGPNLEENMKSIPREQARSNLREESNSILQGGAKSFLQNDSNQSSECKITFDHVSFAYNNAKEEALKNISFSVKAGETVGIIGGTGSGKSTLIQLIPRFYEVTQGNIYVDGMEVTRYPLEQLRKKVGIVPQKAVLFQGTIRENMRWGKKDATDQEIYDALEIAQAKEFVDSKQGKLMEPVLQGGKNLSGGQKQRLTIARAIVGKPEILILDDSASALDYATDWKLRKAISEKTKGMTVFIVSQRSTSIKHADHILVLEEGEMVGFGTHEELLKTCEVYQEICLSQLSKDEVSKR